MHTFDLQDNPCVLAFVCMWPDLAYAFLVSHVMLIHVSCSPHNQLWNKALFASAPWLLDACCLTRIAQTSSDLTAALQDHTIPARGQLATFAVSDRPVQVQADPQQCDRVDRSHNLLVCNAKLVVRVRDRGPLLSMVPCGADRGTQEEALASLEGGLSSSGSSPNPCSARFRLFFHFHLVLRAQVCAYLHDCFSGGSGSTSPYSGNIQCVLAGFCMLACCLVTT
jgi:hypothetical protein